MAKKQLANNINIPNVNDEELMRKIAQLYRFEQAKNPEIDKMQFHIMLIKKGVEVFENLNEIEAFVKSNPKCRIKEKNNKK